jgi:hypothetical protein
VLADEHERRLAEAVAESAHANAEAVKAAPTAAETPVSTNGAAPADALFDSADQTFVRDLLTDTDHAHVVFDGADDWFVRHLLQATGESLPVDSTDAPAGSAPAKSDTAATSLGGGPPHHIP